MSSFPQNFGSEPNVRVNARGAAVYDLPPSLNMPRASVNERQPTRPAEPRVSFQNDRADDVPPRRRPSPVNVGGRRSANHSPTRVSPGLSRLPSLRKDDRRDSGRYIPTRDSFHSDRSDKEHAAREAAREASRQQKADEEATLRHMEAMEAAENRQLDLEAERAASRRDPSRRMPEPFYSHRTSLDSDRAPWSRHSSPPAPPRLPRPVHTGARFASSSPRPTHTTSVRRGSRATVHQYHYPDSPTAMTSRRPSDSLRDRGREVIERERARAAAENFRSALDDGAGGERFQPVFDEAEERVSGREYRYEYVSEGVARQKIQRRRERGDEMKREFWN